jgi:2-hydroxychromene-2-carboxylate isomerase
MNVRFTPLLLCRVPLVSLSLLTGLMLFASASALAKDTSPFPMTPEFHDSIKAADATWPDDPAVPDLPPLPATDDPPIPIDNWLAVRYWDGLHPPKVGAPERLTAVVTSEKPLKADVIWSMRSPYSYLSLQRLVYLASNYNVDITIHPVMPVAVRSTKGGSGKAGGVFALWYKLPFTMWDTVRSGQFEGVGFKWASPDPIWQTIYPVNGENYEMVHPPEKQPYIGWITRLGCYAKLHGKSLDYVNQISPLIWGDRVDHWPAHVKKHFNKIEGLDYDTAIKAIQDNPDKVDKCWLESGKIQEQAGHGGVPLMIFQGEPFFGQDRFYQFFWRLQQSGLTKRWEPRAPFTTRPRTWPADE